MASGRSRRWESRFGPDLDSARRARLALQDELASDAVHPEAIANAVLVLSEIVSNAIRHAGTDFTVRAEVIGSTLRVEVLDHDTRPPALQLLDGDSASGRGLHIVAEVTERWGWSAVERVPTGKVVWAELSLDAGGDELEHLVHAFFTLDAQLSHEVHGKRSPPPTDRGRNFYLVLVRALLHALEMDSPCRAAFADQLRSSWPIALAAT